MQGLAYGIGESAEGMKRNATSLFVLFYYNQVLGLPGTLAGAALFIALLVDGFTDPLVGTWSDHCRSKLGRRHPLMFAAALPVGLASEPLSPGVFPGHSTADRWWSSRLATLVGLFAGIVALRFVLFECSGIAARKRDPPPASGDSTPLIDSATPACGKPTAWETSFLKRTADSSRAGSLVEYNSSTTGRE